VIDIVQVLTQQVDYQTARKYWNKLKQRLTKDGSQTVTDCHRLKLPAADGKNYLTDVATAETLLRLVQSVPSPKAEPIKLAETDDATGLDKNKTAAKTGGNIAKKARQDLETKTGKKVVTSNNYLPPDDQQTIGFVHGKDEADG